MLLMKLCEVVAVLTYERLRTVITASFVIYTCVCRLNCWLCDTFNAFARQMKLIIIALI